MEPAEYRALEAIARQQGVSVGELIRSAVRDRYLLASEGARGAVETICAMNLPIGEWADLERDIGEAHGPSDLH